MLGNYGMYNFSTPRRKLPHRVIVDAFGGGDFTSVKAACDYVSGIADSLKGRSPDGINDQPTGFEILVLPGAYAEDPFETPHGAIIRGINYPQSGNGMNGGEGVRIIPKSDLVDTPFITAKGFLVLENLFLNGKFSASATKELGFISSTTVLTITHCRISASNYSPTYQQYIIDTSGIIYMGFSAVSGGGYSGGIGPWAIYWHPSKNYGSVVRFSWINATKGILYTANQGTMYVFMTKFGADVGGPLSPDIQITGTGIIQVSTCQIANYSGDVRFVDNYVGSNAQSIRQAYIPGVTPMIAKGASGQTANLIEAQDSSGGVKFAIEPDGDIRTVSTSSASMLGSVVGRMPVYNISGTLIGYIPLYDDIT